MSIVSISNSVFRGFKTDIKAKGLSEFVCRKNDFRNSETGVEVTHSTNAYILSNNFTRTNYSIDLRNSVLDDNSNHSIGNNIDTNKFYYLFDGMSQYENKKEVLKAEQYMPGISITLNKLLEFYTDTDFTVPVDINDPYSTKNKKVTKVINTEPVPVSEVPGPEIFTEIITTV